MSGDAAHQQIHGIRDRLAELRDREPGPGSEPPVPTAFDDALAFAERLLAHRTAAETQKGLHTWPCEGMAPGPGALPPYLAF